MAMKRLSITKAQRNTAIGAELLELCQTITEDGSISRDEIIALTKWLKKNQNADLPSIDFLVSTVKAIIADGKVTPQERRDLYKAIERVLPPDLRKDAQAARHWVESEERATARAEREAQSLREKEQRERRKPIASADFMVAGVSHEGRAKVVRAHVHDADQVFLVRDRRNRFSRNAIEVRLSSGFQIGFVPEDDAVRIAPILDEGSRHYAFVKKILTGGRIPLPVVVAHIYRADADIPEAVLQDEAPEKRTPPSALGKDDLCFVATACFGDAQHPTVTTLRCFRDGVLFRYTLGRSFIAWYDHNGACY